MAPLPSAEPVAEMLQFKRFAELAERLRIRARSPVFAAFVARAKPVTVGFLWRRLEENRSELKALCEWTVPERSEILWQAGLRGDETHCTRLVGWMLYPPGEPALALRCQCAWLRALSLQGLDVSSVRKAVTPVFESVTADGRPDLFLDYRDARLLVVVEAKVAAEEHLTPSGLAQTRAYPAAVRRRLGLAPDYPVVMVFLTKDGQLPDATDAIPATYNDLVVALRPVLDAARLEDDLRWAYSVAITHLLRVASRDGSDRPDLPVLKQCLNSERPGDDSILELGRLLRTFSKPRSS
jgi:hypothetical protein